MKRAMFSGVAIAMFVAGFPGVGGPTIPV